MDDVEMLLVKIEGEEAESINTNKDFGDTSQPFQTLRMDIINVSDSNYEHPDEDNTEAYLQAATITDNNLDRRAEVLGYIVNRSGVTVQHFNEQDCSLKPEPVNTTTMQNIDLDDTSQPFQTFGTNKTDTGTMYDFSDSGYAYLRAVSMAENNLDLGDTSQPFQIFNTDIIEAEAAGAGYHLSDPDYEHPGKNNPVELLEAAVIAEKNLEEFLIPKAKGKQKPKLISKMCKKPNILKKKETKHPKKLQAANKQVEDDSMAPIVSRNGTLYTCLLCEDEPVCGEARTIILHVRQTHDARLHICDVCGQDFRKRNELSTHLDEHVATREGDLECEVCNRIFSSLRLFRVHKQMHSGQKKPWVCYTCQKRYSSKNLLDDHINIHTGVRPYICQTCGKDFASKYTFKAHEKTHEVRPRLFQCQHCSKSFLKQRALTQHEEMHSGTKHFPCQFCSKQFVSKRNLDMHSVVHTGSKPFKCGLCEKAFARKAELQDHKRTHADERPYKCDMCSATFKQGSNLRTHKRATHYNDKRYKCEKCEKGFKRKRLLDYHINAVHTGERPYKCSYCNATFIYPEYLTKHTRTHTGEKPYLCEVCNKEFNSRDNRNAHRFVHSDKKPYQCSVCGSGFMRKPLLRQHMQKQGHDSDAMGVSQPILITDADQVITLNAGDELEIVENSEAVIFESIEVTEDYGMENSRPIGHILAQGDEMNADLDSLLYLYEEEIGENESVGYPIIDGQQIQFAEEAGSEEQEGEQVIASIEEFEDTIASETVLDGKTQISQSPDKPI